MTYSNQYKRYDTSYKPGQKTSFKISRSKIDLFVECSRCFWLDRVLGIKRPSTPPFQINKAIDELLKREFDELRNKQTAHHWMIEHKIDAIPFEHKDLNTWRENFVGIQFLHKPTNLLVFGAIDDVWVTPDGELIIVDYKATSKKSEINLDADWQIIYKRQMEVYQWLFRQNGFRVSDTGYFVYANGISDADGFFDKIEFNTKLISYKANDSWIEPTLLDIKKCLEGPMPDKIGKAVMGGDCEYCTYAKARTQLTVDYLNKKTKPTQK
jgi:CRISPR/Cas system-associated exonuclease Cas4 (RecB family)